MESTVQTPPNGSGRDLVGRLQAVFDPDRDGFYPWIGSVMGGGWLAGGGGYRQTLARDIRVDAMAGWSLRNYKVFDADLEMPVGAGGRLQLDVGTRLVDAPRVHFFGIGNDSSPDTETTFDFEPKLVNAELRFNATDRVEVGGGLGLLHVGTGPGSVGPPIETVFSGQDIPGLAQSASYLVLAAHAQVDRRDALDFTRDGDWYRADWTILADRTSDGYGHQRVDLDARHYFPVVNERQAIAVRGLVAATLVSGGNRVPHFMMPTLGDSETLRGYSTQRFKDRHALLLQGEYRFRLNERLHTAAFLDLGKVASRAGELTLGGLHPSYGLGIRLHTKDGFAIRADLARTSERWGLVVSTIVF